LDTNLKNKISAIPYKSGVYFFLDGHSKIIYIGKAINLYKRVSSYFFKSYDNRIQIPALLSKIRNIQFLITKNEREALILENNLIKKNKPYYNICLKDDKTFQSLSINLTHDFPVFKIVRKFKPEDRVLYFGPYLRIGEVKKALRRIIEYFQLRDCSDSEFYRRKKTGKACLKFQMNKCLAPCVSFISQVEYRKNIENAILFLKGKNKEVLKSQLKIINDLSQNLKFEEAGAFYKKLDKMKKLIDQDSIVTGIRGDFDAIGYFQEKDKILFQVLIIRGGNIISYDEASFKDKIGHIEELQRSFIEQYYFDSFRIPDSILVNSNVENEVLLEKILSDYKMSACRIKKPLRGKLRAIVLMAMENAKIKFNDKINKREEQLNLQRKISQVFKIDQKINHIECFDISHSSGKDIVGVKVSYKNNSFNKSSYRKYTIKEQNKGDDYKALYEVLLRRVSRGLKENNLPDMFLIDGGKGQLGIVKRVLDKFNLDIFAVSIAKENHSKSSYDKLFVLNRINSLDLRKNNIILLKMMEIRDETHRFAISFHKKTRRKRILKVKN